MKEGMKVPDTTRVSVVWLTAVGVARGCDRRGRDEEVKS